MFRKVTSMNNTHVPIPQTMMSLKVIRGRLKAPIWFLVDVFLLELMVTLFPSSLIPRIDAKCSLSQIIFTLLTIQMIVARSSSILYFMEHIGIEFADKVEKVNT